jgi:hypothetical protein
MTYMRVVSCRHFQVPTTYEVGWTPGKAFRHNVQESKFCPGSEENHDRQIAQSMAYSLYRLSYKAHQIYAQFRLFLFHTVYGNRSGGSLLIRPPNSCNSARVSAIWAILQLSDFSVSLLHCAMLHSTHKWNYVPIHNVQAANKNSLLGISWFYLDIRFVFQYIRDVQIPDVWSPPWSQSVRRRLILVGPQYGICFLSPFWRLKFWGGF